MSLVDYEHLVRQIDPERFASRPLEDQIVGKRDNLEESMSMSVRCDWHAIRG